MIDVDGARLVFGQEYLYAWHNALLNKASIRVTQAGDSTGAQTDLPVSQRILNIFGEYLTGSGLVDSTKLTLANSSVNGECAEHWRLNRVSADAASNPTLYLLRHGINDPGYVKYPSFQAAPLDYGPEYPSRRKADDTIASLDAGLAVFRASNPLSSCSVALMMPTSTYDVPNGRYSAYYEDLLPKMKDLARKYQCCFIDTYSLLRDSSKGAGLWLDDIMTPGGRGIHPTYVGSVNIASLMVDALIPAVLRKSSSQETSVLELSLSNSWVAWNTSTHGRPRAYKTGKMVTLGGLIKGGVVTPGTLIATLPVGYRPSRSEYFPTCSQSAYGSISIHPNGQVWVDTCPSNSFFSLAGATFYAEQ